MPRAVTDVVVAGCGPAGLCLAAACAERDLSVAVVAPDIDGAWPQTLGVWFDEVEPIGLGSVVAHRLPVVHVHLGEQSARRLPRSYALLDNERLRRLLLTRVRRAGARFAEDRATGVEHGAQASVVRTGGGAELACRVAVDATGHRPRLLRPPRAAPAAVQSAYGLVGRFEPPPVEPGAAMLMDYRPPDGDDGGDPTFLYALDLGSGRFLVEETSLARRAPLPAGELERRLGARLDAARVRPRGELGSEHVRIPMGGPLPDRTQRVVGFGAAAGMVHPATGYQVAAALTRAASVAAALDRALRGGAAPAAASRAAWDAVWPGTLRRQRALHALGLEVLLTLDGAATRRFFGAFFDVPPDRWSRYLSGERSATRLACTMAHVFAHAPPGLQARILAALALRLRARWPLPRR